jgi:hypothetical protein
MPVTIHNLMNSTTAAPASTTVVGSVADNATSLTVAGALSVTAPFLATFADTGEIIRVGTASGTAWSNITRGYDGTTAASHASGTAIELRITARHLTERVPFNVYPQATAQANTLAIRAALAEGYVSMAPGDYPVARTASESTLFTISQDLDFNGNTARIILDGATPNTVDLFQIGGSSTGRESIGGIWGGHFRDVWLDVATSGAGRHAIHFNLTGLGGYILGYDVTRVKIGQQLGAPWPSTREFGNSAIKMTDAGDAAFIPRIRDCIVHGDMNFNLGCDSLLIEACRILSANTRPGIFIDTKAGAGIITVRNNNCIARGGFLHAVMDNSLNNIKVYDNNCEHSFDTAPATGAICRIDSGYECEVSNNRFHRTDSFDVLNMHALHLNGGEANAAYMNQLYSSGNGYDLRVDGSESGHYVGHNRLMRGRYLTTDPDNMRAAL